MTLMLKRIRANYKRQHTIRMAFHELPKTDGQTETEREDNTAYSFGRNCHFLHLFAALNEDTTRNHSMEHYLLIQHVNRQV